MEFERLAFEQPLYADVNVVRVGDTLVDTGHMAAAPAVRGALDGPLAGVERVVLTHPHSDHVGGSQTIGALADRPHVCLSEAVPIVRGFAAYLREAREEMAAGCAGVPGIEGPDSFLDYFRDGDYAEERIRIERTVADGDTVRLGPYDCEVLHTPGHSAQHMALWHASSGTLLSGDLVVPSRRFEYGPLYTDLGAYQDSLARIRTLDADLLVPMHGPPIAEPTVAIDETLRNCRGSSARVAAFVEDRGETWAREVATGVLGARGSAVPYMTLVACTYLRHLAGAGRLTLARSAAGVRVRAA